MLIKWKQELWKSNGINAELVPALQNIVITQKFLWTNNLHFYCSVNLCCLCALYYRKSLKSKKWWNSSTSLSLSLMELSKTLSPGLLVKKNIQFAHGPSTMTMTIFFCVNQSESRIDSSTLESILIIWKQELWKNSGINAKLFPVPKIFLKPPTNTVKQTNYV